MTEVNKNKKPHGGLSIEDRYQRAQALMQGMFSKQVARNTTLVPHWIGNSDYFWYERELKGGKEFRLVDASRKTNQTAFDHKRVAEALAKAAGQAVDAEDLPISKMDMSLSPLRLEFCAFGKRWDYKDSDNECRELETYPDHWLLSPDGTKAAFARDYNLWVRDLKSGEEKALTTDGEAHYRYASVPSAWGMKGASPLPDSMWSPDSRQLFTIQLDTRQVKRLPLMRYVPDEEDLRPIVSAVDRRMALPGDTHIDEYRFLAIDIETGRQQDAHYRRCPVFRNAMGYFVRRHGWWSEDSRHAYFIEMERCGDHVARLIEFDTRTGACRVLIEDGSSDTCFKLRLDSRDPIHTRSLPASDEVIWFSERSGWGHLYLYDQKTGQLKNPITSGDWLVREIHHFDAERRELIIQTAGRQPERDAYYRDICRVNIDTGALTPLVETNHEYVIFDTRSELAINLGSYRDVWGGAGVSPSGRYLATTRSRVDGAPESLLLDREGQEVMTIEQADLSDLPDGWQWPERVKLLAADGQTDIYGVIYRPSHFDPTKSYPVLDNAMSLKEGCSLPAGSFTNNTIAGFRYFEPAALAELGFIVVDIAGRGTSNRHRSFFASPKPAPEVPQSDFMDDHVAGLRQLAERYPYMDLTRVGAGGTVSTSVAVAGLLGHPDFYKVGVANAPGFDARLTPAFFGESYNNLPGDKGNWPDIASLVKNLKGKLLLMHGMVNPTVSVAQSFRLVEALKDANKDFDMLFLPNDGYPVCNYAIRRGWDYLVRHLQGIEPPAEFELKTSMDIVKEINAARMKQAEEASATQGESEVAHEE